jgi:hypothetical protein
MASGIVRKRKRMGYATIASLLDVLAMRKEDKLVFPLTAQELHAKGVPEWNMFILYHTLVDMKFIRDGYPTEVFNNLAQAYQTDQNAYQSILRDHLRDIYSEAYHRIPDLAHASQEQLIDAFKVYDLPKQHRRMVTLFKGLLREIDINSDESEESQTASSQITNTQSSMFLLNDVPLALNEYEPMAEPLHSLKTNGVLHTHLDDSTVMELLTTVEELRQERISPSWREADRARWEKLLKITNTLLGKALELKKGTKE